MLAEDGPAHELARRVAAAASAAGFAPEPRRFRAHITLGRLRRPPPPKTTLENAWPFADLVVGDVVIYRSDLGPGGARYAELARHPLGGRTENEPAPGTRS